MIPDRVARAFPLLLLMLLAGMALMLNHVTELPSLTPSVAMRTPDLTISRFSAVSFGSDGKPLYTLKAERMLRYPDDGRAEFEQASLIRTLPAEPALTITAEKARANANGDKVWFEQNVQMQRAESAEAPSVQLQTRNLLLDTARGTAASDAPTDLQTGGDQVRSTGFDYDHNTAQLRLRSKVSIDYAPPKR
ncbi:LPS export ABC transporter periplasmic protein LptC [Chitinimonas sp. BJB300]|uniref:LPS export ABC transporter periplasmic protein LptC n=1 Tax=Chitinimonas sp. BJB300 TaxID=1559339 RepID=UPI000C11EDAE|nr:LPS export ABC transporter periplasmic protein LptC [Chitinimonas sp. BJB300]PHV10656.1 LPS export ABC transporter periplasmic protein LptC [Chitinimonas sp. BJB300]TSJ90878.1 LPS export ABC transporter periplasmic protein LptC [Chitinimonas sp. BJB300]